MAMIFIFCIAITLVYILLMYWNVKIIGDIKDQINKEEQGYGEETDEGAKEGWQSNG